MYTRILLLTISIREFEVSSEIAILSASIVPVVMFPPSIDVIVEPSIAKSPPVKVTRPENSTLCIAVEPVASVVEKGAVVSMNSSSDDQTLAVELATWVGGVRDQPEVMLLSAPVDQVIVAEGVVSSGVTTAGLVYRVLEAKRGASEPAAPS